MKGPRCRPDDRSRLLWPATMLCLLGLAQVVIHAQSKPRVRTTEGNDWLTAVMSGPESPVQELTESSKAISLHSVVVVDPSDRHNGLRLVWIVCPKNSFDLQVEHVGKLGPAAELYKTVTRSHIAVTVNGGPYSLGQGQAASPLGLVISNGSAISPVAHFTSGGVVFSNSDTPLGIVSIHKFQSASRMTNAVQAKPLLIEDRRLAVFRDKADAEYDRTAIGITVRGDLVIAGAFKDDTQAIKTFDFARFLMLLGTLKGIPMSSALNLDGATDAHIFTPRDGHQYGYQGTNYVPDVIAISVK